jgi:hypothetical protein
VEEIYRDCPFSSQNTPSKAHRVKHECGRIQATAGDHVDGLPARIEISGFRPSGTALGHIIEVIASCVLLMFGYGQSMLSLLFTLHEFQEHLKLLTPEIIATTSVG